MNTRAIIAQFEIGRQPELIEIEPSEVEELGPDLEASVVTGVVARHDLTAICEFPPCLFLVTPALPLFGRVLLHSDEPGQPSLALRQVRELESRIPCRFLITPNILARLQAADAQERKKRRFLNSDI